MKKNSLNIYHIFLSLILILSFSCTLDENESGILKKNQDISFDEINYGELHNNGLGYYYDNRTTDVIQSDLNLFSKELLDVNKQLYPEFFENVQLDKVVELNNQLFGTNKKSEFNYKETLLSLNQRFTDEDIISPGLSNLLQSFIIDNPNIVEIQEALDNFRSTNEISDNDMQTIEILKSILVASDEFWNSKKTNDINPKLWGCNPSHQVRFADAAGGVFGAMLGFSVSAGLGTAIGATLGSQGMSALVEEMQNQNGGNCI